MHADIGDRAARRDDVFAKSERGGDSDGLDRRVHAAADLHRVLSNEVFVTLTIASVGSTRVGFGRYKRAICPALR